MSLEAKLVTQSVFLRRLKPLLTCTGAVEIALVFTLEHLLPEDVCGGVSQIWHGQVLKALVYQNGTPAVYRAWVWVLVFGVLPMWRGCICHEVWQGQPKIFTTHLPQCARTVFISDTSIRK